MDNKIKLLDIYDKAKKMRIVLNQSEFADKLGYSRAHLFKKMEKIPDSLIERAEQLLETESVAKEPAQDYIARRLNSKLHEANTVTYYEVGARAGPVGDTRKL